MNMLAQRDSLSLHQISWLIQYPLKHLQNVVFPFPSPPLLSSILSPSPPSPLKVFMFFQISILISIDNALM